jgi:hypothetical protein
LCQREPKFPQIRVIVVDGLPTRYIGSADAIVAEVRRAGFEIDSVHIEARNSLTEQDDLVIAARRPRVESLPIKVLGLALRLPNGYADPK